MYEPPLIRLAYVVYGRRCKPVQTEAHSVSVQLSSGKKIKWTPYTDPIASDVLSKKIGGELVIPNPNGLGYMARFQYSKWFHGVTKEEAVAGAAVKFILDTCRMHNSNKRTCGCEVSTRTRHSKEHNEAISLGMRGNSNAKGKKNGHGPLTKAHRRKIALAMQARAKGLAANKLVVA